MIIRFGQQLPIPDELNVDKIVNLFRFIKIIVDNQEVSFSEEELKVIQRILTPVQYKIIKRIITKKIQEGLISQFESDLTSQFERNIRNLNISLQQWKECIVKEPVIFFLPPEKINNNVTKAAELLSIEREKYIQAALKQPQLFSQSPETINNNITQAAELLSIEREKYVQAALKQPSLFYKSPETINNNITQAAELLSIEREKYIQAALKQPSLFYQSPETVKVRFDLYNLFVNQDKNQILKTILNNPSFITVAPERIMAFYVLAKLSNEALNLFYNLTKNPLNLARKKLSKENQEIFETLYKYFRRLFERRKKIKRKFSKESEIRAILNHAQSVINYFGSKEQTGLADEQLERIKKLKEKVEKKLKEK